LIKLLQRGISGHTRRSKVIGLRILVFLMKFRVVSSYANPFKKICLRQSRDDSIWNVREARLRILVPATLLITFLLLYFNFRNVTELAIVMLSIPFGLVLPVIYSLVLEFQEQRKSVSEENSTNQSLLT